MHKKLNIAMAEWEQHFQKLQYGLIFDKNNPDATENSENENCGKKLIQNDTGSPQNKSYDKHEIYSLDECAENTVEKLRAIPRHLNINRKKRWTFNLIHKNFLMKQLIQKMKRRRETNAKTCAYATKKTFGIQKKKISLN